jgi:LysR family glycine cleavage system transcriptional activator
MHSKLPPLHLLQLFEAAGRNLSFKKAADELFLTPSAISHQIKSLEQHLGLSLFTRQVRGVKLTEAGTEYLHIVQQALQGLEAGTQQLKHQFTQHKLKISTIASIANNILIPKLADFQARFPDIELSIETDTEVIDLRYEDVDIGIRLGQGNWPGVVSEKIFDLYVSPLCSPAFAERHQLKRVEQLLDVPLIQISVMEQGWTQWLATFGLDSNHLHSALSLGSYDAAILAAQQGLGMALGAIPLENGTLKSGKLVRPFKEQMRFDQSCYAVFTEKNQHRRELSVFLDWLREQLINSP